MQFAFSLQLSIGEVSGHFEDLNHNLDIFYTTIEDALIIFVRLVKLNMSYTFPLVYALDRLNIFHLYERY